MGFRRAGLSPALSLLMSAFALPIPPGKLSLTLHRPTERSPTASGIRGQVSGISLFQDCATNLAASWRSLRTHRAMLATSLIDVSQIETVSNPNPHLICRSDAHLDETPELSLRLALLAKSLGQIRTDRFTRAAQLIRQSVLLDLRHLDRTAMHLKRNFVSTLECL